MTEPTPETQNRSPLRRLMTWLGRHEPTTLVAIGLLAAAVWGFAKLADEVAEQDTQGFDKEILLMFRDPGDPSDPIGPLWLEEAVRDVTALGSFAVLGLLTLAVVGFLALEGKKRVTLLVLAATVGGMVVSTLLKHLFDRPRPDLVPHGQMVLTASFPSGHSMMAAVVYLTLGALLARSQERVVLRAYLLILAALLTLAVGTSRVYLGVHWPTDVLAGWAVGAAWALLCWLVLRWMQRTGKAETDQPAGAAGSE